MTERIDRMNPPRRSPAVVHLDVTHGLRHLPMLVLLAALHLRRTRGARIEEIWYGSYDPDQGSGTVYGLGGLLTFADWLEALAIFDRSGDYGVFAELLQRDGLSEGAARALLLASHGENTLNLTLAHNSLHTVLREIGGLRGVAHLYAPLLEERFAWVRRKNEEARFASLTRQALENGDLLRAAVLLPRAFLERIRKPGEKISDYKVLETIEEEFRDKKRGLEDLLNDYEEAKRIRNALAHASKPLEFDKRTRKSLADPAILRKTLERLVERLLPLPTKTPSRHPSSEIPPDHSGPEA